MLSSCMKTMYVPNMINVPMFEKKGQLNTTLSLRDLQFSYAATENIGFTLNGFYRPKEFSDGGSSMYHSKNQGVDMAICLYKQYTKAANELLLGYGQGFTSFVYSEAPVWYGSGAGGSSHFRKYYLQYDVFWFGRKETTKWAFTTKLDLVSLYDFRDAQDAPLPNCSSLIFTPGLSVRKKLDGVSIFAQIQCPLPSAVADEKLQYSQWGDYPPFHSMVRINVGLIIHILGSKSKED